MNWFKKIITAGDVQDYLKSLGATDDIIRYITFQDPKSSQILSNEFRKNPSLSLSQIMSIPIYQKSDTDPYLEKEKWLANTYGKTPQFYKWILVSLRKLRKGKFYTVIETGRNILPPLFTEILSREDLIRYETFKDKLLEISDWVAMTNVEISSFSPEQAIQMSNEWHKAMAGKGEGLIYEPTKPENIYYGPEWENPRLKGWTIQKVTSKNDLSVEGNRMNHCVGSYDEEVENGNSNIYSLRDPKNNPKVTIEADASNYNIIQIQGNSNSIPDNELKKMIKEWIKSKKNPGLSVFESGSDPFDEISYRYGEIREIEDALSDLIEEGDYGIPVGTSMTSYDIASLAIKIELNTRYPKYSRNLKNIPQSILNWIQYLLQTDYERGKRELEIFEQKLYELDEHIWDFAHNNWDIGERYPQEEDYKTIEEFEQAEEEFKEMESEWMLDAIRNTPQGGFAQDGIKLINELKEKGELPSLKEETQMINSSLQPNWFKKYSNSLEQKTVDKDDNNFSEEEIEKSLSGLPVDTSDKWDYTEDAMYDFYEDQDFYIYEQVESFNNSKPGDRQFWEVAPLDRVKKIWRDYIKFKFVKDEEGINMIQDIVLNNIKKILANTIIAGHTGHKPDQLLKEQGLVLKESPGHDYGDWILDDSGQWRISDFALGKLSNRALELMSAQTPEQKILKIDHIFNVIHRRSDISSWFIEKGSQGLTELGNQ